MTGVMERNKAHAFSQQSAAMSVFREHGFAAMVHSQGLTLNQVMSPPNTTTCCLCVDDGIKVPDNFRGTLRVAGAGVLLGRDRLLQLLKQQKITTVILHFGCGAGKVDAENANLVLSQEESDRRAFGVVSGWLENSGIDCYLLTPSGLKRPKEFHAARGLVIDATGRLDVKRSLLLPDLFVVSASLSLREILDNVRLCWDIARGDHGLGDLLSPEEPFVISLLGEKGQQNNFTQIVETLQPYIKPQLGRIEMRVDEI